MRLAYPDMHPRWKPWEKSTRPKSEAGQARSALRGFKDGYREVLRELARHSFPAEGTCEQGSDRDLNAPLHEGQGRTTLEKNLSASLGDSAFNRR